MCNIYMYFYALGVLSICQLQSTVINVTIQCYVTNHHIQASVPIIILYDCSCCNWPTSLTRVNEIIVSGSRLHHGGFKGARKAAHPNVA